MEIDATKPEGNAFLIMGHVAELMKAAGRADEIPEIMEHMKSGNYANLCRIAEEETFGSIKVVNRVNA